MMLRFFTLILLLSHAQIMQASFSNENLRQLAAECHAEEMQAHAQAQSKLTVISENIATTRQSLKINVLIEELQEKSEWKKSNLKQKLQNDRLKLFAIGVLAGATLGVTAGYLLAHKK